MAGIALFVAAVYGVLSTAVPPSAALAIYGTAVLLLVGLSLIGLMAGVLNVVPFLGSVLPAVPAIVIALAGGWWQIILVVLVFVVANQIDNHVLTTMVPSKSTKLRPTVVVRAVVGGFAAGGIVGAVVAIPVAAFLKAMYVRYSLASTFDRGGDGWELGCACIAMRRSGRTSRL